MGFWNYQKGILRDYHRDPFPYSRLRTREIIKVTLFPTMWLSTTKEAQQGKRAKEYYSRT